ncbi:MAG TPA: XdhC family protein [Chthonomonadales bacterium]|nr:XdhC family protein [Chthonomonadales bacterium]
MKSVYDEAQDTLRLCSSPGAALASLVMKEGSAYRRPGACMLVWRDGARLGAISGGCLEADVVERARALLDSGKTEYVVYDNRGDGEAMYELGCHGVLGVLIEPLREETHRQFLDRRKALAQNRQWSVSATVYRIAAGSPLREGQRMLVSRDSYWSTMEDAHAVEHIREESLDLLSRCEERPDAYAPGDIPSAYTMRCSQCGADVLLEPAPPPVKLLLVGAGEDAIPVAGAAAALGWEVAVADHRPGFLTTDRFPMAASLLHGRPEEQTDLVSPDSRTACVVMTHHFEIDRGWLGRVLHSNAFYIGQLGPRKRTERIIESLNLAHGASAAPGLVRLYAPAGLDIGSETPEEIALAIVSEIQAVLRAGSGLSLREARAREVEEHVERSDSTVAGLDEKCAV